MSELDLGSSAGDIAKYYGDFIDGFVLDQRDSHLCTAIGDAGIRTFCCDIVMSTIDDRCRLAQDVVDFTGTLN